MLRYTGVDFDIMSKKNSRFFFCSRNSYLAFLAQFVVRPHEVEPDIALASKAAGFTMQFLSAPSSQHERAAKETLQEAGGENLENDPAASRILEKEIVKECKEFASLASDQPLFLPSGQLGLDSLFSSSLAKIGAHGKKLADEIMAASSNWSQAYWSRRKTQLLFKLWSDPELHPYHCRFLKLLAEILWKDRVAQQYEKSQKQLPAITQSVHRPLSRVLSARATVLVEQGRPTILFEGKAIAQTPAVDPEILSLIEKGARSFSTIYHHKLLRYLCIKGFENWIEDKKEPGVIRIDGGGTQLAEELGFKFKEAPSILKGILYAQAYMHFFFDDGSQGSLIALKKYRAPSTRREEGLEIHLCEQLMPTYTFQTTRQRKLLVPLPSFPPFVSAPQYHAGQALLQMLVMEEFTQRSMELSSQGSIEIPHERWNDFFRQSDLPESVFVQTLERWNGLFFIKTSQSRLSFAEAFQKEHRFLQAQGAIRTERQRQARISVRKRQASLAL